uniref:Ribosomal protein S11 n=1 Tax=Physarum polycephalum TaxID=5791 RepID=F2Y9U5_PHYPO|nr:ribosomal protein S11 [Physarum polycephalum]|eukprot:Phypoly_transcript_00269.p2 GENE.Phypoly_transcript_00269~~Phypoly_transcript_00269.p2  ORF type:complete len:252 (-),score=-26.90 Phypoly_transcript_00269:1630-2385(-)
MLKTFVRGRLYRTKIKRRRKYKKPTFIRIAKLRRKFKAKIKRSFGIKKTKRRKRKRYLSESYFRRYIFPKGRPLYKRTIRFNADLPIYYQEENSILMKLRRDLRRQEVNRMLNKQFKSDIIFTPLSERFFFFGRIYLTHRRRNTFITISTIAEDKLNLDERVFFKSSCGLLEYKGPKRSTLHARLEVAKACGSFVAQAAFSSVDIIFPSGVGRVFTRLVRALVERQIYVRYLIIPKRRSHGLTRKKKVRRL